jgi:hypothetical protein
MLVFGVMSGVLHFATFEALGRAAAKAAVTFAAEPAPIAGETLDVDPPAPRSFEAPQETPDETPSRPATAPAPDTKAPEPAPRYAAAARERATAASAAATPEVKPAVFGAVGVAYASDLARTFTGTFPQTASADPAWDTIALGSAGTAEVTLVIDETGHLTGSSVAGAPSQTLRRGVERAVGLLGPRCFTARQPVTRLRVTARVSRNDVHDGLHGDVYALSGAGGAFSGTVETLFFARPSPGGGRRVDLEFRLLP